MAAGRPAPSPSGSSCSRASAVAAGEREEEEAAAAEALPWEVRLVAAEASRAEHRAASRLLAGSNAELLWRQRRLEKEAMAAQGQEKAQEVREGEPLGGALPAQPPGTGRVKL